MSKRSTYDVMHELKVARAESAMMSSDVRLTLAYLDNTQYQPIDKSLIIRRIKFGFVRMSVDILNFCFVVNFMLNADNSFLL